MRANKFIILGMAAAVASILSSGAALADGGVDITSQKGITIGGAVGGAGGKFVPWGASVVLAESDSFLQSNGKCAFNVNYDMANTGSAPTALPFKNTITVNGAAVAINSALTLGAGQSKQILTQPYLVPGNYDLKLKLDSENALAETSETNNDFSVHVIFNGSCGAKAPEPKADLVSQNGITIGGAIGGAGGKHASWGGTIVLHTADTFLQSNGRCAVNISYDMENIGTALAGPAFVNRIYSGTTLVSQQSALSLDKGAIKQINTQAYLTPGTNVVRLVLDDGNLVAEGNEGNNTTGVNVLLDSNCGAAPAVTSTTKAVTTTTKEATTTTRKDGTSTTRKDGTTTTVKAVTTTTSATQRK